MLCPTEILDFLKSLKSLHMTSRTGQPNQYGRILEQLLIKHQIQKPDTLSLSNFALRLYHNIVLQPKCRKSHCEKLVRITISDNKPVISPYCSIKCYKSDPLAGKKISDIKLKLYSNQSWKEKTEQKKIQTNFKKYGVEHGMQNVSIFEKQQKACFTNAKEVKGMRLIGFEPLAYEYLEMIYGNNILSGSTFLKELNLEIKWFDEKGNSHRSYPDFYIPDEKSFVEVKGVYTRDKHHYKIMKAKF